MKSLTSIFATVLVGLTLVAAAPPSELSPDGLPPLRLGMTPEEAEQVLGRKLVVDYGDESTCDYADTQKDGVGVMFVNGMLVRVDVNHGRAVLMRG